MSSEDKNKRVSISYTVDLKEVPNRVDMLLRELSKTLHAIAEVSNKAAEDTVAGASCEISDDRALQGLRAIYKLKVFIDKAQVRADDCYNILKGFLLMSADASKPPPAPPPPPTPPPQEEVKKKTTKKKTTKKKTTKKRVSKKTPNKKKEE